MCPTSTEAHRALIAEDHPPTAAMLVEVARSLGHTARVATNLEEIDAAIVDGDYCYVLLDKGLPAGPGDVALTSTGDTALRRLRKRDPRRRGGPDDYHLTPIIVVTGSADDPSFVVRNLHLGASDFIPKPLYGEPLADAILAAMHRAGRDDHAVCGLLAASRPSAAPADTPAGARELTEAAVVRVALVRLSIDGIRIGRRTSFHVNGKRRALRDALFLVLLKLAAWRVREPEAWLSAHELGILRAPEIPSRIHEELAGAVPDGFFVIQRGESRMLRLHPLVVVDHIDWATLERHPHPGIQRVAAAERKRR